MQDDGVESVGPSDSSIPNAAAHAGPAPHLHLPPPFPPRAVPQAISPDLTPERSLSYSGLSWDGRPMQQFVKVSVDPATAAAVASFLLEGCGMSPEQVHGSGRDPRDLSHRPSLTGSCST